MREQRVAPSAGWRAAIRPAKGRRGGASSPARGRARAAGGEAEHAPAVADTSSASRMRSGRGRRSWLLARGLWRRGPAGHLHRALHVSTRFLPSPGARYSLLCETISRLASKWPARAHRPLDDHADVLAEHLRRHAAGLHVHGRAAVVDVELEPSRRPRFTTSPWPPCRRGGSSRRRPCRPRRAARWAPVVDEVLADAAGGDHDEGERAATASAPITNQRSRRAADAGRRQRVHRVGSVRAGPGAALGTQRAMQTETA